MIIVSSFILGVVQALTEFLPISSSAHLILARSALDFDAIDGLTFDVALHLGTLAAVVAYFYRDLGALIGSFFSLIRSPRLDEDHGQRLVLYIAMASVPAALAGLFFEQVIEFYFRNPTVIVITLVLGGILFLMAERMTKHERDLSSLSARGALLIGFAQALALIPGVSRSGITIVAGLTQKLKRETAARFSFLMSVPLLVGAGGKKMVDASNAGIANGQWVVLAVGALTSGVVGWLVIRFLMRFLQHHRLDAFAYYRFVLAAVVAAYLVFR